MKFASRENVLPPDSHIGWLIAVVSTIVAVHAYQSASIVLFFSAAVCGVIAALLAMVSPRYLRPLNYFWMKLAQNLSRVVSPLVLGVLYFIVVTPLAVVLRFVGRDELDIRRVSKTGFWRVRDKNYDAQRSLKDQF
jgi:hypothetical protein